MLPDLFDTPIKTKEVRKGCTAYQYRNGVINIDGNRYQCHSLTSAIKTYRQNFPKRKKTK